MNIYDVNVLRLGARAYHIIPEERTLYIGNTANCGLYCNIGHGLYQQFADVINHNLEKRDWIIKFSDMSCWVNHSANGVVLPYLFDDYDNIAANIPKDPKLKLANWGTNGLHKTSELCQVNKYFAQCFKTNKKVMEIIQNFETKYNIDYANTLGVCYRGTDKYLECKLTSSDIWIEQTKNILQTNSNLRVLIQTDQEQVRDSFVKEFGDICFFLEEISTTTSNVVMHRIVPKEKKITHTKNIHAAVIILSKCKYLINHAGNTGYAVSAYRGTADNMWQFCNTGELMCPKQLHDEKH